MSVPIVSYVTFNRAGLVARNLKALLETDSDFELYIVDNGSRDGTWEYVQTLQDTRIKEKKRFEANKGVIYAINYVLSHRKADQYFIHLDSDVCMHTKDFVEHFMKAFQAFPEVGLMGASAQASVNGDETYHKLTTKDGISIYKLPEVSGCCLCFRPEVFNILGYFCEETCGADLEISKRVSKYAGYEVGSLPSVKLDQLQGVGCEQCLIRDKCQLGKGKTCYDMWKERYKHLEFYHQMIAPKNKKFFQEVDEGVRSAYCASIHDEESMKNHYYDKASAEENFNFFITRAN